jgi:N-acetylmuramate 1-kinase
MSQADARLALVLDWLRRDVRLGVERIEPASSDASFRRYFRVFHARGTFVVMDAPPPNEDVRPYLEVSGLLEALGIHVPHVHESDRERGLVLLEDLGSTPYLARLERGGDPDALYGDALDALAQIQARGGEAAKALAPYDREPLMREMALMPEWFCTRHLELDLSAEEREVIVQAFEWLTREALAQPQVLVHRDYHSRNLMVTAARNPGVIDFQDALRGPAAYDLVSLLKDCYIAWPRARVLGWVSAYRARLLAHGAAAAAGTAGAVGAAGVAGAAAAHAARAAAGSSDAELTRWFDLIGVQRHLKVLGIFARLWYRDGKPGYLADLPLTLQYLLDTCVLYPPLAELGRFLQDRVAPELPRANARVAAVRAAGASGASSGPDPSGARAARPNRPREG